MPRRHSPASPRSGAYIVVAAEHELASSQALSEGKGLYNLDAAKLAELRPDVILTQDICNVCSIDLAAVQRTASKMNPPPKIVSLDPGGLKDVLRDIAKVMQAPCPRARAVQPPCRSASVFPLFHHIITRQVCT